MLPPAELTRAAGTSRHGGVVAVAWPRPVPTFDAARPPLVPLLLVLDGVGNPHNLGAIARSAAFFGVGVVLLREGAGQAKLSGAAYRTAEGGMEHLELYRAADLAACLGALKPRYRTVAAALTEDAVPPSGVPRDRSRWCSATRSAASRGWRWKPATAGSGFPPGGAARRA
jgi:RNA methyltransferase, TrmH family